MYCMLIIFLIFSHIINNDICVHDKYAEAQKQEEKEEKKRGERIMGS